MNTEELFEICQEEINDIYDGYDLNEQTKEKLEKAVKEVLINKINITPADFISIVSAVASGANPMTKQGRFVGLSDKKMIKRVNRVVEAYGEGDKKLVKNITYQQD